MKLLAISEDRNSKIAGPIETLEDAEVLQFEKGGTPLRYIRILLQGAARIRRTRPDTLIVNRDGPLGCVVAALSFAYRVPLIVRLGGDPWRDHRSKSRENLLNWIKHGLQMRLNAVTFRRAAGFFVVSEELKRSVSERTGCGPGRVHVIHSSIDVDDFSSDSVPVSGKYGGTGDGPVILTVTNLDFRGKYEGVRDALSEIGRVLKERDATFTVAGGGTYLPHLRRYVSDMDPEVSRRVQVPGYVEDIHRLYDSADVFLYVSYSDGYPNVVLEAQASGLPVIVNAAHGMVEQVEHGVTGLLVDLSREGGTRRALERMLDDRELRERVSAAAKKKVAEENTHEKAGAEMKRAAVTILETVDPRS